MILKDGIVTYECDKDSKGVEILNSTQRNNQLVWPPEKEYPLAQYRTSWKNMCNVTSMVMALEYAGFKFPTGQFTQPEDNLAYFILTDTRVREYFQKSMPAMYTLFIRSLEGKCTPTELNQMCFPTEIHDILAYGTNLWIGTSAVEFKQNLNFKKALWAYMVKDNKPMVISTTFGGFGHIVTVTGVTYKAQDCPPVDATIPEVTPLSILVDDPWGKYNPTTNTYDSPSGGNDIEIPWNVVQAKVKPCNSPIMKWAHCFKQSACTI